MRRGTLVVAWGLSLAVSGLLGWESHALMGTPPAASADFGSVREFAPSWKEIFVRTPCCPSGTWVRIVESSDSPVAATAKDARGNPVHIRADGTATLTPR